LMRTHSTRPSEIERKWLVVDASERTLGRLATEVASLLKGKHKPIYAPHLDVGDYVVVVNASKVRVTGRKPTQKTYYRHSNYPGGLKSISYAEMMEKHPTRAIEYAVKGMLPHNRLGRAMAKKLKVYAGADHPHEAQVRAAAKKEA
jgi:large subunit ribosomal protein L13